jgi:hypothetical protein
MFKSLKKFLCRLLYLSLGQTLSDITAFGLTLGQTNLYMTHNPLHSYVILLTPETLLSHGLAFDWITSQPTAYAELNNKSAMTNIAELRSTIAAWEAGDFLQRLSTPPLCVNPTMVAVQYNVTRDSTKCLPCIDLSRHVNLAIAKSTMKLDDLSLVQELIEPENYMTSLDLENQNFLVQL